MKTPYPTVNELTEAIEQATAKVLNDLFQQHPGRFFYVSLITSGEAHPPVLTAWSEQALENAIQRESNKNDARKRLKWDFGESPFYRFGDDCFESVRKLFGARPDIGALEDDAYDAEYDLRLNAMEAAMSKLDQRGFFGRGEDRLGIVINVEVIPPDSSNTERAMRLNPPDALRSWLKEAAEPLE